MSKKYYKKPQDKFNAEKENNSQLSSAKQLNTKKMTTKEETPTAREAIQ